MNQKKFSLFPYLWKYKWHYLAGVIVLFLVDGASLYVPQYTGEIIDGLSAGELDMDGVWGLLLKILAAGLVMMFGRFGWRYFITGASRGIEYRMRNDMFGHLETLSARYFNSHKTGDLMAHFTNDLQAVRMAVGMAVVTAFDAAVMTVMVLVKMIFYVDLGLTVLAFIPLTLVAVGCYFYGIESKKRQLARQEAFSALSDFAQENFSGIAVIKAFVKEAKELSANTVFLETSFGETVLYNSEGMPQAKESIDMLKYASEKAKAEGLFVYVVFDVLKILCINHVKSVKTHRTCYV